MRSDKKGISAIVATVLIILITVAAVTIIWAAIIPMIQNQLPSENTFGTRVNVVTSTGYTAYDKAQERLFVQVDQQGDASRIEIIVGNEGTSHTFNVIGVPGNNQMKTYELDLTGIFPELADTLTVRAIPYILTDSGKERVGTASGDVEVKSSNIVVDDVCDVDNLGLCDESNCVSDGGGYWYDGVCNENPQCTGSAAYSLPTSATCNSEMGSNPCVYAYDGAIGTVWVSSTNTNPQPMTLDMGSVKCISGINVRSLAVSQITKVEVSEDGNSWRTVIDSLEVLGNGDDDKNAFSEVLGKYVKLDFSSTPSFTDIAEVTINVRDVSS